MSALTVPILLAINGFVPKMLGIVCIRKFGYQHDVCSCPFWSYFTDFASALGLLALCSTLR